MRAVVKAKLRVLFHGRCRGAARSAAIAAIAVAFTASIMGLLVLFFPDVHRLDAGRIFVEFASVHDFVAAAGASHHVDGRAKR